MKPDANIYDIYNPKRQAPQDLIDPTPAELATLRALSAGLDKVLAACGKPAASHLEQLLIAAVNEHARGGMDSPFLSGYTHGWRAALRAAGVPFLLALALLLPASAHASSRPRGYHPRPTAPIHQPAPPRPHLPRPHGPRRPR